MVFFSVFLLHLFSDLLHCFGCMTVSCGSPIFGVCFCDTGVGVTCDDILKREELSLFKLSKNTKERT